MGKSSQAKKQKRQDGGPWEKRGRAETGQMERQTRGGETRTDPERQGEDRGGRKRRWSPSEPGLDLATHPTSGLVQGKAVQPWTAQLWEAEAKGLVPRLGLVITAHERLRQEGCRQFEAPPGYRVRL